MTAQQNMHVYVPTGDGQNQETLMSLQGFEISLSIEEGNPSLIYQPTGQRAYVKVYDPAERKDVDNDYRAWRFMFLVTRVQILSSGIYVLGYSRGPHPFSAADISSFLCEDDHRPWEHDGNCYSEGWGYEGWLELHLYPTDGKKMEPTYEFNGPLEIFGREKV